MLRPLSRLVTRTLVPSGRVRCAAVSAFMSNATPLAVVRPWCHSPYHDARPISSNRSRLRSSTPPSSSTRASWRISASADASSRQSGSSDSIAATPGDGGGPPGKNEANVCCIAAKAVAAAIAANGRRLLHGSAMAKHRLDARPLFGQTSNDAFSAGFPGQIGRPLRVIY